MIAGSARGRKLKRVPGSSTRPITDRVKESLFNILGADVVDSTWLDLFAGTGSVGIEALSRGARHVHFIDVDRQAIQTVRTNLDATGLGDRAQVRRMDAFRFLAGRPPDPFDFIFVAPPQYRSMWSKTLRALDKGPHWLAPDGRVIVQIDPREEAVETLQNLVRFDQRRYGNTLLIFYKLQ